MRPTLVILAAGMGSRYGGLKQIDPLGPNGETMLDYALRDARAAGFGKIVFVIRRDFEEAFRETVGARVPPDLATAYAFQELDDLPPPHRPPADRGKPWGTAHATRAARAAVDGPFAVVNADDFYGPTAYRTIAGWLRERDPAKPAVALVAYRLDRTLSEHGPVNRGVCAVEAGLLRKIEETEALVRRDDGRIVSRRDEGAAPAKAFAGTEPVSMNFSGFTPAVFPLLEESFERFLGKRATDPKAECYLPAVVDEWISAGLVQCPVLSTDSPWFGITYPGDKELVAAALREQGATGSAGTS